MIGCERKVFLNVCKCHVYVLSSHFDYWYSFAYSGWSFQICCSEIISIAKSFEHVWKKKLLICFYYYSFWKSDVCVIRINLISLIRLRLSICNQTRFLFYFCKLYISKLTLFKLFFLYYYKFIIFLQEGKDDIKSSTLAKCFCCWSWRCCRISLFRSAYCSSIFLWFKCLP